MPASFRPKPSNTFVAKHFYCASKATHGRTSLKYVGFMSVPF